MAPRIPLSPVPDSKNSQIAPAAAAVAVARLKMKKKNTKREMEKKLMKAQMKAKMIRERALPGLKLYTAMRPLRKIFFAESEDLMGDPADFSHLRADIFDSLNGHCQILIVVADSESWGNILLPFYLASCGSTRIASTRPSSAQANADATTAHLYSRARRLQEIGYRPERSSLGEHGCEGTIMYMSVHSLLEEMIDDGDLSSYSVVVIEEAHVRTLSTDVLLGMLLRLARRRPAIRIVLMVAPFAGHEAANLSEFFCRHSIRTKTTLVPLPAHMTDPTILYAEPPESVYSDPLEAALGAVFEVHRKEAPGRMLLFLPGTGRGDSKAMVDDAVQVLRQRIARSSDPEDAKLVILPLYLGNATEVISRIVEAYADPLVGPEKLAYQRWVFVAGHDVVSIDFGGVRYVVDPGIAKDGTSWITRQSAYKRTLVSTTVSKDKNPKCFRLYKENVYRDEMAATTAPEILTCSSDKLAIMLRMMMQQLGIAKPWEFDFIDQPPIQTLVSAMENLEGMSLPDISRLTLD